LVRIIYGAKVRKNLEEGRLKTEERRKKPLSQSVHYGTQRNIKIIRKSWDYVALNSHEQGEF
jgi:hypothetical protein